MSKSSIEIQELLFNNPRLTKAGVEVLPLTELRKRLSKQLLAVPQRVDFHHLLLLERGLMSHMVDFVEHRLAAGSVLLMRPGQVQQWRPWQDVEGLVLLISSEALPPASTHLDVNMSLLSLSDWPTVFTPPSSTFLNVLNHLSALHKDLLAFEGMDVEVALTRHMLMAILLRLARELPIHHHRQSVTREESLHALFLKELESSYMNRWNVLNYAQRLGYSESALSRACVTTVGRTAKEIIDRRVALEAKRLLVHSPITIVEIGYRLGFSQTTNFLKFFKRVVGCTPVEFRKMPH